MNFCKSTSNRDTGVQKQPEVVCPICEAKMGSWLSVPGDWRRPMAAESYQLLRCSECDFGRLHPTPDPEAIEEYYDLDEYYTHGSGKKSSNGSFVSRLREHLAWRFDNGVEPDDAWIDQLVARGIHRVCDVGCGGGDMLIKLAERRISAIGIEPDSGARAFASSKGAEVIPGTAEDLPEGLGPFDAVLMSHVLEHTRDSMKALNGAWKILAPGGILCVEVPNNSCRGLDYAGDCWYWLDAPRHLNYFSAPNLSRAMDTAGFAVERIEFRGYCRQFQFSWELAEERIRDFMNSRNTRPVAKPKYWSLLLSTLFADDAKKYDSIRVICRK